MATIDPNIALGVKPIQIENPMNQYAAMSQIQNAQNQNALAQYQLSAAQRTDEAQNVQNQLYAKHYNPQTGEVNKAGLFADLSKNPNAAGLIPKLQSQFTELEQKANLNKKTALEASGLDFKQRIEKMNKAVTDIINLNSPKEAMLSIDKHLANGDIDQDKANQLKQSIAQTPNFRDWQKNTAMGILDVKQKFEVEHQNATLAETGRHNIKTEGIQQQGVNIQGGQLNLAQQKFAFDTNPVKQAEMANAKKLAELGATETISQIKDVEGARKVLKTIGLDPKTGANKVTDLIKKSTGSYGGALVDAAGRVFGESTEGADAIGQLKTFETKIATDLLGGKLGAGISNTDRDFIMAGLGQISDNTLPRDTREKAWGQVVDRMRSVGLLDTPTKANSSNAAKPSLNDIFGK